jgi:hypothetical protein
MPAYKLHREKRVQTSLYPTESELGKFTVIAEKERRSASEMIIILALEALAARLERARAANLVQ